MALLLEVPDSPINQVTPNVDSFPALIIIYKILSKLLKNYLSRALACSSLACPWLAPRGRQPELAGAASWNTGGSMTGSCLNTGDGFSEAL